MLTRIFIVSFVFLFWHYLAYGRCPPNTDDVTPKSGVVVKIVTTSLKDQCLLHVKTDKEIIVGVSTALCKTPEEHVISFIARTPCCDGGEPIGCNVEETTLGVKKFWTKPRHYPVLYPATL